METIKVSKGLKLPISGEPTQNITNLTPPQHVALLGEDYVGLKPTMLVGEGDHVKLGQVVFTDKKNPGVKYTAPGSGTVVAINRGEKRAFLSLVIKLDDAEEVTFSSYSAEELPKLGKEKIVQQLLESGQWTSLKTRPFSKAPNPESTPHSIFITAMDTNPLAPNIDVILKGQKDSFQAGVTVLAQLTTGTTFLCTAPGSSINANGVKKVEFAGKHPAGLAGTHIQKLDPVGKNKTVWSVNAQDVIAIGHLFLTGKIEVNRIVSIGGPAAKNPRLLRTRVGACLDEVLENECVDGDVRIISGSVYTGHNATGPRAFLGRFHQIISLIKENYSRTMIGWMLPGFNLYSIKNVVASKLIPNKKYAFDSAKNGADRAIVPVGSYEKVMPLDIEPTYLLRSLIINDVEEAEKLGCLELDEEDLALCSFVCPSKIDHGANLRETLTIIEKEG